MRFGLVSFWPDSECLAGDGAGTGADKNDWHKKNEEDDDEDDEQKKNDEGIAQNFFA